MIVRDIMISPAPCVAPEASVASVAQLVLTNGVPGAPVVEATGKLIGMVTDKDLVAKHARLHLPVYLGILGGILPLETHRTDEDVRHILGVTARDVMTADVETIGPEADVDDAATTMVDRDADMLVVLDGEQVVGVLTRRDIIRLLVLEENDADAGQ